MLKRIQEPEAWEPQINQAAFEALDMAIEALDCSESPNSSDTISRQAAIDAFDGVKVDEENCTEYDIGYNDGIDFAVSRLSVLPSAQLDKLRWIPCSERLPEESGTYTVTAYDGATNRVTYAKYQKRLKRWELTGARAYWRVLAWCPPPEPYKEDDNEG